MYLGLQVIFKIYTTIWVTVDQKFWIVRVDDQNERCDI